MRAASIGRWPTKYCRSRTQPEILRVWGLGRLLGKKPAKEMTSDRWISDTRGPADQVPPGSQSISQDMEFKSKSSSMGHGLDEIAVADLEYDSPRVDQNPRPVEMPKSARSGAELFQKGLKGELVVGALRCWMRMLTLRGMVAEWHVIMEGADRDVSGQSADPAKPRKRSL